MTKIVLVVVDEEEIEELIHHTQKHYNSTEHSQHCMMRVLRASKS
jgi:hypothetical protein